MISGVIPVISPALTAPSVYSVKEWRIAAFERTVGSVTVTQYYILYVSWEWTLMEASYLVILRKPGPPSFVQICICLCWSVTLFTQRANRVTHAEPTHCPWQRNLFASDEVHSSSGADEGGKAKAGTTFLLNNKGYVSLADRETLALDLTQWSMFLHVTWREGGLPRWTNIVCDNGTCFPEITSYLSGYWPGFLQITR